MGGGLDGYSWTAGIGLARLIVELSRSGMTGCTSLIPVRAAERSGKKSRNSTKVKKISSSTRGISLSTATPSRSLAPSFQVSADRYHFLTRLRAAPRNSNVIQLQRMKFFRKLGGNEKERTSISIYYDITVIYRALYFAQARSHGNFDICGLGKLPVDELQRAVVSDS